jgi:DNA-binding transcriptional MerR regulator
LKTYTSHQIAKIVDVPERKLLSYIERGYVSPSYRQANGPGTRRLWTYEDVLKIAVIHELSQFFTVEMLRKIANRMNESLLKTAPSYVTFNLKGFAYFVQPISVIKNRIDFRLEEVEN